MSSGGARISGARGQMSYFSYLSPLPWLKLPYFGAPPSGARGQLPVAEPGSRGASCPPGALARRDGAPSTPRTAPPAGGAGGKNRRKE
jgi:hypothetical protein